MRAAPRQAAVQAPDQAVLQRAYQAGEQALAAGRYAEAEKAYEELLRLSPATAEVHAKLGLIYFQEGKFAEAIPVLRQALTLKPSLPNLDVLLAMSLSELGHDEESLPGLKKGFHQTADAALKRMAGLHLERAYSGLGRDDDAAAVALELSRQYPKDPEVLYHSARILSNLAYLQTMKLADVAPDSIWLHQAAGEGNESQSLYDAAIHEYQRVLAQAPNRPGIHFRIGRVLLAKSNQGSDAAAQAQALREFQQELAIDPTNANAAYEAGEIEADRRDRQGHRLFSKCRYALSGLRGSAPRPRPCARRGRTRGPGLTALAEGRVVEERR